ncbi:MAG: VOC family protein [Cyclobacteriaceae bacterium]|nr:VOC family protein [Cyclobacteriaceae bacterium]
MSQAFSIKKMSVQFVVKDIEQSIQYYTTVLGFSLEFRYEDFYAGVVLGDCSIHLKTVDPSPEERTSKRVTESLDILISVEGIEALFETLSSRSVLFTQVLRTMPYGKEFYLADPDGYIIAFVES